MKDIPTIDFRNESIKEGQILGIATLPIDEHLVKNYLDIFRPGRNPGTTVPAFVLAMQTHRIIAEQPDRPPGAVHVIQYSEYHLPVPIGSVLIVKARVDKKWVKKNKTWVTYILEGYLDDGTLAYVSHSTSILPD